MDETNAPVFSFVLPAHNELPNLEPMTDRIRAVAEELGQPFEIVWVNDGSTDGTGERLAEMAEEDTRVRPVHLTRNFGHMAALTAGLECARGTGAVVCMDADGQHPPEVIPELVTRWRAGAEIVQVVKTRTDDETLIERTSKGIFVRLMKHIGEFELPRGAADFRLLDREVVDAINSLPENVRFVRGLVCWVGFTMDFVECEAPARLAGESKYGLWSLTLLALNGITSFSTRPLRISFVIGAVVMLVAFAYALVVLSLHLLGIPIEPEGWSSLLLVITGLGGIQLMALGIASEYLARLYAEVKNRPVYLVRKKPPRSRHDGT